MSELPRGYQGINEERAAGAWPLRAPYNHRYTAHPVVPMARMMRDSSFKHVPWDEVAEAIRICMRSECSADGFDAMAYDKKKSMWTAWHSRNNQNWDGRYFIHFKDSLDCRERVLCDEEAFVLGVKRIFGFSCMLCDKVFFPKVGTPYYIELDYCIEVRHQDSCPISKNPLHCYDCNREYEKWIFKNYKLAEDAAKTVRAYRRAAEHNDSLMRSELNSVPKGPGSRAKRLEIKERYGEKLSERDVWKALATRWLINRISPPTSPPKKASRAKRNQAQQLAA